ncbi:MAG TPA: DUF222 domain-containing protein [Ilumatobacteraceae bacterium]|nr:DUF222 domain-containing protein [Ilumatobacteraceae bacterium]
MVATFVDNLRDELAGFDDVAVTERFRRLELEARRVEAELAVVIAEAERRRLFLDDGHRSMAGWLRANANLANRQIRPRLQLADLVDDLPVVIDTLAAGHIGIAQAEQLATVAANPRCGSLLADSIEVLLEQAEQLPHVDAKRCLDRWVMFADLDGAHRQRELDHERRTAAVIELDGTVHMSASGGTALVAAELQTIFQHFLDAEFAADSAERLEVHGANAANALLPRTDAQRRFDALVTIFRTAAAASADGRTTARPLDMVLYLICDQTSFEGQLAHDGLIPTPADLPATDWSQRRSETTDGTVLLPADAVRAALHGHIRRVVINTAGIPVDVGRKRRLFAGVAREVARLLGHHCDHPGCTVPSSQCEIDHLDEWVRHGGVTNLDNAGLQCTSDNRNKERTRLHVYRDPNGRPHTQRRDGTWIHPVGQRQQHPQALAPPGDEQIEHLTKLARARAAALQRTAS